MNYFNQESDRLFYRKLSTDDITSWLEFFDNNDRLHFLGMDVSKGKETLAADWINAQLNRYDQNNFGQQAIILKESGEFIGVGGIIPRDLNGQKEYEITYSLKPKFWGKGFATEIATTMKQIGVDNIKSNRFISIIEVENTQSANVALKNGMNVLFQTEFMGMKVNVFGIDVN